MSDTAALPHQGKPIPIFLRPNPDQYDWKVALMAALFIVITIIVVAMNG